MLETKAFPIRISKEMWKFLKKVSADQEMPMNKIVNNCLEEYKNTYKSKNKKVDKQ